MLHAGFITVNAFFTAFTFELNALVLLRTNGGFYNFMLLLLLTCPLRF